LQEYEEEENGEQRDYVRAVEQLAGLRVADGVAYRLEPLAPVPGCATDRLK
jgi:hypothetical protein